MIVQFHWEKYLCRTIKCKNMIFAAQISPQSLKLEQYPERESLYASLKLSFFFWYLLLPSPAQHWAGKILVWACIVLLAIGTDSSRREFYSYTSTPSFPPFIVLTDRHVLPHIIVLKQWTETVLKPQAWMLLTNYSWLARTWCAEYRYFVFRTHKHW